MSNVRSAVVLLSGGMDSATLLYYLAHQGCQVLPLTIHYGQRHARELAAAAAVCKRLGVLPTICDLSNIKPLLRGSSQTDDVAVPEGHYEDPVMRLTVVPNRNMILLAVASAMAIGNGSRTVAYAAHAGDHACYPDCRPEFVDALQVALHLCHYDGGVDLYAPFLGQTKAQIADLGTTLKVPYELTYSCYAGRILHCGLCGTCCERRLCFEDAGLHDPIDYECSLAETKAKMGYPV
jgi:7-cyano-7-deazaguanine synthase